MTVRQEAPQQNIIKPNPVPTIYKEKKKKERKYIQDGQYTKAGT
jgi:hypothetical protein